MAHTHTSHHIGIALEQLSARSLLGGVVAVGEVTAAGQVQAHDTCVRRQQGRVHLKHKATLKPTSQPLMEPLFATRKVALRQSEKTKAPQSWQGYRSRAARSRPTASHSS